MHKSTRPSPYSRFRRSESDYLINQANFKAPFLRSSQSWDGNLSPCALTKELSYLTVDSIAQKSRQFSINSTGSDDDLGVFLPSGRKSEPAFPVEWQETSLHLKNETITWEVLKKKLESFPRLEELVLENVEIINLHLMDSKIFLPNLKSYTFESTSQSDLDWEEIFFFYTKESKKGWTINDIWSLGVNFQVSCKDWFILIVKAESKLALSGKCVQEEFGTWGLSEFLHKLAKGEAKDFPRYISIGSHMVLKSIAYAEPIEITELNLIDVKVKTGTVNSILKNIKGLKTFRYFSKPGDGLEYSSLSPETIEEIHLSGISIDLFDARPQWKPLSELKHLWLTESWMGNGILIPDIALRFPQLEFLNLQGIQTGEENIALEASYFPSIKDLTADNQVKVSSGNKTPVVSRQSSLRFNAYPSN